MEPLTAMAPAAEPPGETAADQRIEAFWIEILSRHHEVLSRHRCVAAEIRIGRGYDNDVILDDPHVAANHLRIRRTSDGHLVADDIGSRGGLFIGDGTEPQRQIRIDGHTLLRIGSTLLRVRTSDHVVEPERPLIGNRGLWPLALTLVAIVSAITLLNLWAEDIDEPQASHYVTRLLLLLAVGAVWTTGWAITSRIFGGAMRYGRHLAIGFGALFALALYESVTQVGAYALAAGGIARYTYIGSWLLFGGTCLLHLLTISPRHPALKAAGVLVIIGLAIGGETVSQGDARRLIGPSSVVRRLEPPLFRMKPPVSDDHFFAASGNLKAALDRARVKEQPPAGSDSFDSESDD